MRRPGSESGRPGRAVIGPSDAVVVIPARYGSTRLPGKPLLAETGTPLVVHVAERARGARLAGTVVVATDDERIRQVVEEAGHCAVMTRPDHDNGTSRVAEAAASLEQEVQLVVNVQGDEPMIEPKLIDRLIERLRVGSEPMVTVASPFGAEEDPDDVHVVKVVVDRRDRALYFSRARVPFPCTAEPAAPLKHVGLYGYRRSFLETYVNLASTPAERSEGLEQLRALEHGHPIGIVHARVDHHGIDTPEQYARFVALYERTRLSPGRAQGRRDV